MTWVIGKEKSQQIFLSRLFFLKYFLCCAPLFPSTFPNCRRGGSSNKDRKQPFNRFRNKSSDTQICLRFMLIGSPLNCHTTGLNIPFSNKWLIGYKLLAILKEEGVIFLSGIHQSAATCVRNRMYSNTNVETS